MEVPNRCYLLILLNALLLPYAASNKHACGPGVDSLGVTSPRGDIFVEYGNPLEIYCSLNPAKLNGQAYNSSLMYFSYDNEMVESDYTSIVNETTIRLYMERPPKWKKLVNCEMRPPGSSAQLVCLNYVFVGEKPQPLTDFNCISYNWENLNCSWTRHTNYVLTEYRVVFVLKKNNNGFAYQCPGLKPKEPIPPGRNYCVWNASTDPTYRLPYPHYFFLIEANNTFGLMKQNVTIDHYASVLPLKPVNLTVFESTSESLAITWAVNYVLQNFPTGMNHKIMYQSKYDNSGSWQTINLAYGKNHNILTYNITGLQYAHTLYDIRVMMKPVVADDRHWSEPAATTFHTNATVPGAAPRTTVGGFEVTNAGLSGETRDVVVYWQHIPKSIENGDNFEYKFSKIVEFGPNGPRKSYLTPSIVTRTYAQFKLLSNYRHEFTVVSSNELGISQSSSTIVVPAKDEMLREPDHFIKSSHGHGVWELNWTVDPNATSYTVFWCENKQDRPYECEGLLNWTQVEVGKDIKNDTAIYWLNLQVDKLYQLALSSNSVTSSSGMIWALCTILSGKESNKLKNIWINKIGSDFIEVKWIYDCVNIHEGFQLHYCPIKEPEKEKPTCKEPEKILDVRGKSEEFAVITGLKPYTTYSVYFSTKKNIRLSKDLLNTTLEAAPDKPPHDVGYGDVTSTSVALSWQRPTELNGVLRYYIVHWNNTVTFNSTKVESRSNGYTLEKLKSYCDYDIKVQACTTACSANSSVVSVKTKVGVPGITEVPSVHFFNNTSGQMEVKWSSPHDLAAEAIEFFEVLVKLSDGANDSKDKIHITKENRLEIPTDCGTNTQSSGSRYYKVKVRAVNRAEDGNLLYGPWSSSGEGNCLNIKNHPSVPVLVLMTAVGFLSVVAVGITVIYLIRYGWLRCKDMQNVGVKLPPQLELSHVKELHISPVYELHGAGPSVIVYPDYKEKGGMDLQMSSHVCPPTLKPMDSSDIVPPPDQQLLLDKKDKEESLESSNEDSEEGAGDQESSGCGSGSVSSSITAGTHITDSGTEADERPSTPPDVFGETPRRKGGSRSSTNLSSLSGSGGEGYSRLGPAPAVNSGYVTVAAATRGYVSHPPIWSQNPSKGYVTVGPPKTNCD